MKSDWFLPELKQLYNFNTGSDYFYQIFRIKKDLLSRSFSINKSLSKSD
jgi:hypothetical protein